MEKIGLTSSAFDMDLLVDGAILSQLERVECAKGLNGSSMAHNVLILDSKMNCCFDEKWMSYQYSWSATPISVDSVCGNALTSLHIPWKSNIGVAND